ncbi:MAG: BREX-1 system phosphatase PglZ type A [Ignavibacteriaceae bacterium]|nr:BREX-1 system phosphatase PglZ type A [Ignavibacteriaceae bacterium]
MDLRPVLAEYFQKTDVVFWYDKEGEYNIEINTLLPEGVTLLRLDNNHFGIKYRIYNSAAGSRFLIYSCNEKPLPENDPLLGLLLTGREFLPDKLSLLMNELGLPDHLRSLIAERMVFFDNKIRKEKFLNLIKGESINSDSVERILTHITTGSETPHLDTIILTLLEKAANGDKETFNNLNKFKLHNYLFRTLNETFGFISQDHNFEEFGIFLMKNEFERCILNRETVNGSSTGKNAGWKPGAKAFLNNWMHNKNHENSFRYFADLYEKLYATGSRIAAFDYQRFTDCIAPEEVEKFIILGIINSSAEQLIDSERVQQIINVRKYFFFYPDYENLYEAVKYYLKMKEQINSFRPGFETFEAGADYYVKHGYQTDLYYRKFYYHLKRGKNSGLLAKLKESAEDLYINNFNFLLEKAWTDALRKLKVWQSASLPMQKEFFNRFVKPTAAAGKRIFVVISDALRYEAGSELHDRIQRLNRFDARIDALVAQIPSYTQLGMASLLPDSNAEISNEGDSVLINGESTQGMANREKILRKFIQESKVFNAAEFRAFDNETGREAVKGCNVVYIYHNVIDKTGDDKASEPDAFDAVEQAFEDLEDLLRKITNFNGTNIIITSDHGFFYTERYPEETQFLNAEDFGEIKVLKRRAAFGINLKSGDEVHHFSAKNAGLKSEYDFIFPVGKKLFRISGAGTRFNHGGLSLQEVIIPVIIVNKKRVENISKVDVEFISRSTTLSSNRPVFELVQKSPISAKTLPRELSVGIYSSDGLLISDTVRVMFDSKSEDLRERTKKITLRMQSGIEKYNNKEVILKLSEISEKVSDEIPYHDFTLLMSIAITNDFDDF